MDQSKTTNITIVEDDIYLREELSHTFTKKGYNVYCVASFVLPTQEIIASLPDVVILDINLPGQSGYTICRELKAQATFPILILTSRDTLDDELHALGIGADDFLTKPCPPGRLIARIERLLHTYENIQNILQVGDLTLNSDNYKLAWKSASIILSETEGKIVKILLENYPNIVSKESLFENIWGGIDFVDENILQVNITRLRKNLDTLGLRDIIKTWRGQGYQLVIEGGERSHADI